MLRDDLLGFCFFGPKVDVSKHNTPWPRSQGPGGHQWLWKHRFSPPCLSFPLWKCRIFGVFFNFKKIAHFLGWVNMGEWKAAGWVAQAGYSKVWLWGSAGGKRPPCPVLAAHHVFAVCLIMHRFLFSLETFKQPWKYPHSGLILSSLNFYLG